MNIRGEREQRKRRTISLTYRSIVASAQRNDGGCERATETPKVVLGHHTSDDGQLGYQTFRINRSQDQTGSGSKGFENIGGSHAKAVAGASNEAELNPCMGIANGEELLVAMFVDHEVSHRWSGSGQGVIGIDQD